MGEKYEYKPEDTESYRKLDIEDTSYEMAFAEARRMFGNIQGKYFLDFGCGAGRSTRFLKELGAKNVIGVDHNQSMIFQAQTIKENGIEFHLITEKIPLADGTLDGAFSSSVFVEIKSLDEMKKAMIEIWRVLKPGGIFILTTANPQAFGHEFKSYSRTDNPENLKSGNVTKCIMKGKKPFVIEDIYWTEKDYRQVLESGGFTVEEVTFPKAETAGDWLDETKVAPEMVIKTRKKG